MFDKKKKAPERKAITSLPEPAQKLPNPPPKFPGPKILLLDCEDEIERGLVASGFNVASGSLGTPYAVEQSDKVAPVIPNGGFPNDYSEREIVVLDLVANSRLPGPTGKKLTSDGDTDWWAKCNKGFIDPRARLAAHARNDLDRIQTHSGVFVVFADERVEQELYLGCSGYNGFRGEREITDDNWSFLSCLNASNILVSPASGSEIVIKDEAYLGRILKKHIEGTDYLCTFTVPQYLSSTLYVIAENKFGQTVSAVLLPKNGGPLLLFPQVGDKAKFLTDLFKEGLPELCPELFPHIEGSNWVHRPEYELSKVIELKKRINSLEEGTRRQIDEIEKEISTERSDNGFVHELLRGTDSALVKAVETVLTKFGFKDVVNADEHLKREGSTKRRAEDLQILDRSPGLLIEVKGITSLPNDETVLSSFKYLAPRMKEWGRTDLQALSIINHQRHIPGLDREHDKVFRQEVLDNADHNSLGLMTTWDLYRLLRGFLSNNWDPSTVLPLFYGTGRIEPLPTHYTFLGEIARFWKDKNAIGIEVSDDLAVGDRIAFELPTDFCEEIVTSLEVGGSTTTAISKGTQVGVLIKEHFKLLKKGMRVFRIRTKAS